MTSTSANGCPALLKSGENKGKPCGKPATHDGFCGIHKPKTIARVESAAPATTSAQAVSVSNDATSLAMPALGVPARMEVVQGDCLDVMRTMDADSAQIVICDPPYNIGKDFGNDSDKQTLDEYLKWCDRWIAECLRVLRPNGTMFVYGFSETLALILARVPMSVNRRWLVWHYTNKTVPSLNFWQRSHESILVLWKVDKVFNRDAVREPYTEEFLEGSSGRERPATVGRFSNGTRSTTYTAHPEGALPRDVIKMPTLAGSNNERFRAVIDDKEVVHPTQKPLSLCEKLLKSCEQGPNAGPVLIPFAGSGSECLACKHLGLPFVAIELNSVYVELIKRRLADG